VSGLAHVFEAAGIPTTLVSLIREHTEKMRPPRALWVPFELGRPFGPPGNAALQTRVLEHALRLLEAPAGPVLEDFPEEAPASDDAGWSCPVQFRPPATSGDGAMQDPGSAVRQEVALLAPWYERGCAARGRTTVGVSGLPLSDVLNVLCAPLDAASSQAFDADGIRLAAEDLKAYYLEAATARTSRAAPGSTGSGATPAAVHYCGRCRRASSTARMPSCACSRACCWCRGRRHEHCRASSVRPSRARTGHRLWMSDTRASGACA
jgi:hypothetical protein